MQQKKSKSTPSSVSINTSVICLSRLQMPNPTPLNKKKAKRSKGQKIKYTVKKKDNPLPFITNDDGEGVSCLMKRKE